MTEVVETEAYDFVSPIAQPALSGRLMSRGVKLLKKGVEYEQTIKVNSKNRQVLRGVAEVVKAIRKGATGIVFMAVDVYPIDVISHIPVYCEEKNVLYCFMGTRLTLGAACKTKRPTSVVMIIAPSASLDYSKSYKKLYRAIKEVHPYF